MIHPPKTGINISRDFQKIFRNYAKYQPEDRCKLIWRGNK
jgi:hypothetical protein